VGEDVADGFGEIAFLADQLEAHAQPGLQGRQDRRALFLPYRSSLVRRSAADRRLHGVELPDAGDGLGGDGRLRRVLLVQQLVEVAAGVDPAEGELDSPLLGQSLVGAVAVGLQDAAVAGQMLRRRRGRPIAGVDEGHARRLGPAPRAVVTGVGPELAELGSSSPRLQHRRPGLVGEELSRALQLFQHPCVQRLQQLGGCPGPVRQGRAVEHDAAAGVHLGLTI
jgi:hypothetical protein